MNLDHPVSMKVLPLKVIGKRRQDKEVEKKSKIDKGLRPFVLR